ncbi:helix-turn-helix domain-containing protein [Clostridium sp. WILCCON 0269]|uniref:Helix-turn-helix domain-containing protein n=1 Tax=Candidatus Clostridium eludens TaxID=3381663 RepID=A0ABW8SFQ6_9CLOT
MSISENIKKYRKTRGFTQKTLALILDKSERMIQKYESSEVTPSMEVIKAISAALSIKISDLIEDYNTKDITSEEATSYFLEHYLYILGYEIIREMKNGYLILKSKDGEFEINLLDIEDLKSSSKSFIEFKMSQIIKKSRKIGK